MKSQGIWDKYYIGSPESFRNIELVKVFHIFSFSTKVYEKFYKSIRRKFCRFKNEWKHLRVKCLCQTLKQLVLLLCTLHLYEDLKKVVLKMHWESTVCLFGQDCSCFSVSSNPLATPEVWRIVKLFLDVRLNLKRGIAISVRNLIT